MKIIKPVNPPMASWCTLMLSAALMINPALADEETRGVGPLAGSEMAKWQHGFVFASEQQGLVLENNNKLTSIMPGQFEYLSIFENIGLTYDTQVDQVQGINLSLTNAYRFPLLPKRSFQVEWLCLQPRAVDNNLYAWIGDDEGRAEQWLLMSGKQWQPQLMRGLSVTLGAVKCAVDTREQLYVIDNQQGLWRYPAAPHMPAESELVTALPDNQLTGLVFHDNQLVMLDEEGQIFNQQGEVIANPFDDLQSLESLYIDGDSVWAYSDHNDRFYMRKWQGVANKALSSGASASQTQIIEVPTEVESDIADRAGDTMDDPAIWVHPSEPEKSRILGTNKRWGLLSFNMQGQQIQQIGAGRVNNVDIRQGVQLGGESRDLAIASNRDRNSLSIFDINEQGELTQLTEQATSLNDIYGLCLYQPKEDELFVFVNEKSGVIAQIALQWQDNHLKATEVATYRVPSQPEGCVADDKRHKLFLGEENEGIWLFDLADANPQASAKMIIKAGGPLVADIEGLSLYQPGDEAGYLVVSSQGNDSYLLYDSAPPFAYVDRFRIGVNAQQGHDGSAETDGLDVTSSAVGSGVWAQGMMVVQDGRNRMPDENQNFKWVPWSAITSALKL
ncbi:phytase [Shewanella sp. UCD-KL12]|uniref:phytase n=1 Tax=Shewanella sp. UCD-KL12 TaxID=1917163 RepID=UPI0009FA95E3|nr:phytase [Shewanella sp. UCD-KL12]